MGNSINDQAELRTTLGTSPRSGEQPEDSRWARAWESNYKSHYTLDKNKIITDLKSVTKQIQEILNSYNDEEFKSIVIPHPLLGKISIQELFYLMSYHPLHHKNNAIQNLKNK